MNAANDSDQNVLKKHAAFFDRNNDGVIYPWETFQGFRAIGSGILLSTIAAVYINVSLSRKTRPVCIIYILLFFSYFFMIYSYLILNLRLQLPRLSSSRIFCWNCLELCDFVLLEFALRS
ncbi:putative plant seed peroxygenase [Helianthus annuus]|nr:putative plant seed peroxygenase [Helianthus annuus]KAJ0676351.1 putative plant seed peroxygenase [Helianthus annuus]